MRFVKAVLIAFAVTISGDNAVARMHFVGSWSASTQPSLNEVKVENQTLRQIVKTSLAGVGLRLRISNAFGKEPLTLGRVYVGLWDKTKQRVFGNREVKFGTSSSFTLRPGTEIYSDTVPVAVPGLTELAISIYFPGASELASYHALASQTSYLSPVGDFSALEFFPSAQKASSWFSISAVDVVSSQTARSVVAFGDSITDGYSSSPNENRRYPDFLAARLTQARLPLGVLNQGISANRVLGNNTDPFAPSLSALRRFEHDALSAPGVSSIIFLEGINDISATSPNADPRVISSRLIAAYKELIAHSHRRGIRIIGATLTPIGGTGFDTPSRQQAREIVNEWIRSSQAFDAIIDFAAVIANPSNPQRMLPAYDSGDHLHPSDLGYKAMAESIDLKIL